MSKSSEVEGGGIAIATTAGGSTDALAEVSPVEEGGGGATPEGSTLGRLKLAKTGTYGSNNVYRLRRRKLN